MFEVVKLSEKHPGDFGQKKEKKNPVKLLQLEMFSSEISTSKIYYTNLF